MAASLLDLLSVPDLGLVELHRATTSANDISWASSSDLLDPTPFLVDHQLLLTTGRQFADESDAATFASYAARLKARSVLAVGFGTEVLRNGTPPGLVEACREADLALIEVPYRTPFLAIIRMVAREVERAARQRDDWASAASRAISAAALSHGEVTPVLRELAARLNGRVRLFNADGELEQAFPRPRASDADPAVVDEVRRLMSGGTRAALEFDEGAARTLLQTIGPAGAIAGALAITGARWDRAARTVLAAAIALIEVSVAVSRRTKRSDLARDAVILRLLREHRVDLANEVAEASGTAIHARAVLVASSPRDEATARSLAEREVRDGSLIAVEEGRIIVVASERAASAAVKRLTSGGQAVGIAPVGSLADVDTGIARADAARRRAHPGQAVSWADMPSPMDAETASDLAAAVLTPIASTPAGALEIAAARAWFAENCNWGAAARLLGLHPHTVRDRVESLSSRLGLSTDRFAGRASLWAALEAFPRAGPLPERRSS